MTVKQTKSSTRFTLGMPQGTISVVFFDIVKNGVGCKFVKAFWRTIEIKLDHYVWNKEMTWFLGWCSFPFISFQRV